MRMFARLRFFEIVLLVSGSCVVQFAQADWLLNAYGSSNRYQVFTFGDDGIVSDVTPLPLPRQSHGAAWPSAVLAGSDRAVAYASSMAANGKWTSVSRWERGEGGWKHTGTVLAADQSEPHGIGPTWVGYDPQAAAEPWLMYYLVRGPGGPGQAVRLATSMDGVNWTRRGVVLESRNPISISTVCRAADGRLIMAVHGYNSSLSKAASYFAYSSSAAGPFSVATTAFLPDNWYSKMWARAGNALLTLPRGVAVQIGVPLVSEKTGEVMVPRRQIGALVYLESPLRHDYDWIPVASIGRNKVDISNLNHLPDGSWRATITGYGAVSSMLNEYTTDITSPDLDGPWRYAGNGLSFEPWFPEGQRSTENPDRFSHGIECGNSPG